MAVVAAGAKSEHGRIVPVGPWSVGATASCLLTPFSAPIRPCMAHLAMRHYNYTPYDARPPTWYVATFPFALHGLQYAAV